MSPSCFLLTVPADIRDTIHLWPMDVMRKERAQASPRALVPMSVLVGVCACACVHTPLRAVIHDGLFQTMPLYLSPFILAAGRLRAVGALWQILKEGSLPAAILYEKTQLKARLYCLKGAVRPKAVFGMIKWRKWERKHEFITDLLSACPKSNKWGGGGARRKQRGL